MPRKTAPQTQPAPAGPDIALHMLMNDSAPVLLDWVLHHHHAGFRSITVHGDGANAQATALAQSLAAAGLIDFVPATRPGIAHDKARQIRALDLALEKAMQDRNDHLLWLEPDDFVIIDIGAGQLADLAQGLGQFPDLLSLTMQVAGGSGQSRYADLAPTERFRRGTGNATGKMSVATPLRTIFRPQLARGVKPARPTLKPKFARGKEPVTWLNGAAEDVSERYLQKGWMTMPDQPGLGLAHVIAFMAQDRETFLLRRTGAGKTLPFITPEHLRTTIQQYQRLNFAMADIGPDQAFLRAHRDRRADFLTRHPKVASRHAAVVAEFSGRLDRLLANQDPRAAAIITAFVEGRPIQATAFDWPVPFGVTATPPALSEMDSAWAERLSRPEAEDAPQEEDWDDTDDDDAQAAPVAPVQPAPDAAPQIAAPAWLSDLRLSGQAHGFYHSMPNYACTYVARSREHLLVSFDNLASVREHPVTREPWGYKFIRKEGWSHLGILSYVPGWFRDAALHRYLMSLRDSGFFEQFDQVTLFGTSMGGYGAAAFASLAPGCRVAAFSPQSTLSPRLAGWDQRYPTGKRSDWTGPFADAAAESRLAAQVWLFYDPAVDHDRRHVQRFDGPNVTRVPLRHADHKTALMLRNGRVLSDVMRDIATGAATLPRMMQHYRACRHLPDYLAGVRARADRGTNAARLTRVDRLIADLSRPGAADR
ncbi:hypothetical protein [Paracoccus sp. Ld10]|uniref:hypothetical protein n=1 Tax=Paracoccus sp. Ld10 TaxID=649158 RepID=UPI00386FBF6F